jgi:BirA family biotin operon repressor/biotin-[acetyl-CoA-carboxylase] ligase
MTLDQSILSALRTAGAGSTSGADLATNLGVTRAAIWSHVKELRSLGYEIEASPHDGYRLIGVPDLLHADDLLSRIAPGQIIGRDIRVFEKTTSTNDVVEKLAQDGVKEGVVVFAESQTKGRGRLGRAWMSPVRKGLWFSVLLRPKINTQSVTQLTVAAATAMSRAIKSHTGLPVEIKWPNDLLLHGLKFGGILTELNAEPDSVRYVVLGIGLDVNISASEFPESLRKIATSLKAQLGRSVHRPDLAEKLLSELDRDYQRICAGNFEDIADEWERQCTTIGRNVTVSIGPSQIRGRAESLDPAGALLVRTEHGRLERIIGGDVQIEK